MNDDELERAMERLGLHYLLGHHVDLVARATKGGLGPRQVLELIAGHEVEERTRRGTERRLKAARIGRFRSLADFDWSWPKRIPREQLEELMQLSFISEPANVVLAGPPGVGKTMIAKNLAHKAVLKGHSTLFVEAADMLADLEAQATPEALKRRIRRYVQPQLLVIDEVGYLSYSARAGDLMFQVLTKRHEVSATVLTTNVAFRDWPAVFPSSSCIVAMIDRLTHRAEIIPIEAGSYRARETQNRQKAKTEEPASTGQETSRRPKRRTDHDQETKA